MLKRKLSSFVAASAICLVITLGSCSGENNKAKDPAVDSGTITKPMMDSAKLLMDKDTVVSRPLKPGN